MFNFHFCFTFIVFFPLQVLSFFLFILYFNKYYYYYYYYCNLFLYLNRKLQQFTFFIFLLPLIYTFLAKIFSFSPSLQIISTSTQTIRLRETNESHVYSDYCGKPWLLFLQHSRGYRVLDHWTFYYFSIHFLFFFYPFLSPHPFFSIYDSLMTRAKYQLHFKSVLGFILSHRKSKDCNRNICYSLLYELQQSILINWRHVLSEYLEPHEQNATRSLTGLNREFSFY